MSICWIRRDLACTHLHGLRPGSSGALIRRVPTSNTRPCSPRRGSLPQPPMDKVRRPPPIPQSLLLTRRPATGSGTPLCPSADIRKSGRLPPVDATVTRGWPAIFEAIHAVIRRQIPPATDPWDPGSIFHMDEQAKTLEGARAGEDERGDHLSMQFDFTPGAVQPGSKRNEQLFCRSWARLTRLVLVRAPADELERRVSQWAHDGGDAGGGDVWRGGAYCASRRDRNFHA